MGKEDRRWCNHHRCRRASSSLPAGNLENAPRTIIIGTDVVFTSAIKALMTEAAHWNVSRYVDRIKTSRFRALHWFEVAVVIRPVNGCPAASLGAWVISGRTPPPSEALMCRFV